jgi:hypothetical protein
VGGWFIGDADALRQLCKARSGEKTARTNCIRKVIEPAASLTEQFPP